MPRLAPDLAPAERNLRKLEHFWPCLVASLIVFGTVGASHDELLVHKVLLLLLAIPIPEFDLLADHAEPSERIPAAGEGRHPTNLFGTGRAAHAYCGQLVTGG